MNNIDFTANHHNEMDLSALCDEYRTILQESGFNEPSFTDFNADAIIEKLIVTCEWTPESAKALVEISITNGAFFLRNAAALAIAVGVED